MELVTPPRLIAGQGTPETDWQAWPGLHAIQACAMDELVPTGRRAVVVAPHPDDEVLAFGGLLAMRARAGFDSLVLAVTDGEASHPGSALWPQDRLAEERTAESCEGLRRLGVTPGCRIRLGIPDGEVAGRVDDLAARLEAILRPDDVVLSTWALDGHPDHEATADAVALAVARAITSGGCIHLQAPVWMWHWAAPADRQVPWARMRRLALPADVLLQKEQAIAAHETQLATQDTGTPPVLTPFSLERVLRSSEFFILPESTP
ncbi:MAG: PIG-L family deacetylase [Comamonadaceae bacterium]|nr:MAG: PIG-L family deacetylase [Comamonadaceae bacterium]